LVLFPKTTEIKIEICKKIHFAELCDANNGNFELGKPAYLDFSLFKAPKCFTGSQNALEPTKNLVFDFVHPRFKWYSAKMVGDGAIRGRRANESVRLEME